MNYTDAVAYLDRHIGQGVRPGLERISALLDLMANPEAGYPIIHIAGSNGKTSTARIATFLLAAHGLKVGTFTSPHLERIEQRFALSGVDLTREEFADAVEDVAPFADLLQEQIGDPPTYFELTAAVAFGLFAEKAVDVAVVEVGLGGRLDATNAADGKVAVVTSISREHTDYLGETLAEIAREKLAITKPDSVLVLGKLPPEALSEAEKVREALGVRAVALTRDFDVEPTMAVGGWTIDIDGVYGRYEGVFIPAHGRHQTRNTAVAAVAVEEMLGRPLVPEAVIEAMAELTLPGRLEVLGRRPLLVLDGAHNAEGFELLGGVLAEEFPALKWTLVFGVRGDKDLETMIGSLATQLRTVVTCAADSPRVVPAPEVADRVRGVLGSATEVITSSGVAEAVDIALAQTEPDGAVLVTGSLYVVGEARTHLRDG
ncbi:MAG: bifunctional folylpolyglutamate synthase/dihydrofolate synthase [Acidimicrobiia bacterium]